ncbi:hypothetical protein [Amycolatopsis sp. NPDC021455]|uniref:hypothetical protein n=1 Tax=Amycolatopsis sp. NPDC021455 TaxID=3154901 RepID=UPI00340A8BA0
MITEILLAATLAVTPGWEVVPLTPEPGNLVATTALSAHDVWTAGFAVDQEIVDGRPTVTFQPRTWHWNGKAWSRVPVPPLADGRTGRLNAIAAAAPGRVWAVGDSWSHGRTSSLIERWDGKAWSPVPAGDDPGLDQHLYGVAAIGDSDAWAVGSTADGEHTRPMARHWDGVRWKSTPLPADLVDGDLFAVAASGPADVWAAGVVADGDGVAPLVLHWNGVAWRRIALPSTAGLGQARVQALTVSDGQVRAVGDSTTDGALNRKPLVFRLTPWGAVIERTPDERGQLNAVTTVGREVWAVGYQYDEAGDTHAYALRRGIDGQWRRAAVPDAAGATLFGLTRVPGTGTLWTTGAMNGAQQGVPAPLVARLS